MGPGATGARPRRAAAPRGCRAPCAKGERGGRVHRLIGRQRAPPSCLTSGRPAHLQAARTRPTMTRLSSRSCATVSALRRCSGGEREGRGVARLAPQPRPTRLHPERSPRVLQQRSSRGALRVARQDELAELCGLGGSAEGEARLRGAGGERGGAKRSETAGCHR